MAPLDTDMDTGRVDPGDAPQQQQQQVEGVAAHMRCIQEEVRKAMDEGFGRLGDAVEEHDKRIRDLEGWKDATAVRIDKLELLEREAEQRMARMEEMLNGSGPDAPPPPGDHWDTLADPAVSQVSMPDWVEEGVLYEKLAKLCAEANIALAMVEVYCGTSSSPVAAAAPEKRFVPRRGARVRGSGNGSSTSGTDSGQRPHPDERLAPVGGGAQRRGQDAPLQLRGPLSGRRREGAGDEAVGDAVEQARFPGQEERGRLGRLAAHCSRPRPGLTGTGRQVGVQRRGHAQPRRRQGRGQASS